MAAIVAAATKAKTAPFVIVSTSRTQVEVIHKHCKAACPNAVIKKYNSDLSAANRRDFDDVNKVWANVDILIYLNHQHWLQFQTPMLHWCLWIFLIVEHRL